MKPTPLIVVLCCLASGDGIPLLGKRGLPKLVRSTPVGLASFQFPPWEFFPTLEPLSVSPFLPMALYMMDSSSTENLSFKLSLSRHISPATLP